MPLRLLSYNVHKCRGGLDRRLDPWRVARAIALFMPDIALLQEVQAPKDKEGRGQADILGDRLGYRHRAFIAHAARLDGICYGNAILSRYPIVQTRFIDLSVPFKKRRGALHALIRARSPEGRTRTVHVYNLHLGLSGIERKAQLRQFLGSHPFAHLHARAPIIVGGDFNDFWGTLGRKILVPAGLRGQSSRIFTFPAFAPVRALDAFYFRGDMEILHIERGKGPLCRQASDHLPLAADVRLSS